MNRRTLSTAITLVAILGTLAAAQYATKVYFPQGGSSLEVASGGAINVQSGGALKTDAIAEYTASTGVNCTSRLTTTDGVSSGTARVVGGRAYSQVAAGTAHTASTDEAVLGSYTIPANTIKQGSVLKVRFQGIATATNSTDTLTVNLRLGPTTLVGTALITIGPTDATNNDIFWGEFELVARAAPGATAACVGMGSHAALAAVGGAVVTDYKASTNFATNGALLLEVTADWSSTSAGNSCRLDILTVEIL